MPIEVSPNVQYKSLTPNSLPAKIKKWYKSAKGGVINCMRTVLPLYRLYVVYPSEYIWKIQLCYVLIAFLPFPSLLLFAFVSSLESRHLKISCGSHDCHRICYMHHATYGHLFQYRHKQHCSLSNRGSLKDYILTTTYYYDMFLVIIDIVTIALILITKGYGTHISMVLASLQYGF